MADHSALSRRRLLASAGLALPALFVPDVAVATGGGARVVGEERAGPRLRDLVVESPALGATAGVRLLTPAGWRRRRHTDRWPVLYLLHAAFEPETYRTWTLESDIVEWPELRDVLVVMPEGGLAGFYSDWWNGGRGGPPAWERFHLDELLPILERGYGAGRHRVTAGMSMGGFGAVSYAARRPRLFRAAASFSGPVHLLHPEFLQVWPDLAVAAGEFGVDLSRLWGDPVAQRRIWGHHDPYRLARRLRGTAVFLSCGDGNPGELDPDSPFDPAEAVLRQANRSLADRLARLGHPAMTFFHTGTHHPAYAAQALRRALPLLRAALCGAAAVADGSPG